MSFHRIKNVRIEAISTVCGGHVESVDNLSFLTKDPEKLKNLKEKVGLSQIHMAGSGVTAVDLCEEATKNIFANEDIDLSTIKGLIFVTQTPDYFLPSNAALIHGKFNLDNSCASFDINQGCAGYVYGLWLAQLILQNSHNGDRVLLLTGDTMTKALSEDDPSTKPLFGDSGTATLLIADNKAEKASFFDLNMEGSGCGSLMIKNGGFRELSCKGTTSNPLLAMSGLDIYNKAMKFAPECVENVLTYADKSKSDISGFIFHQANDFVIRNLTKKLDLDPAKVPLGIVGKYGNSGPSSIPTTICSSYFGKSLKKTSDFLLCGFGTGFSWASCILSLSESKILKLNVLENNE